MTFLNPAVLIGLLAGIIPIALHFINLRKLKKIDFSTLYFMEELRKSKIRKLKFRQWLLLLLRLLLIIFLVLAFAKPAVKSGIGIAGERAKQTAMFILDDSPSMTAPASNASVFNEAKSAIKEVASRFTNDDILYLQPLSASGKSYAKLNRDKLLKLLPSIHATDVHSSLSGQIIRGVHFIAGSKTLKKEILVFSDFQKTGLDSATLQKVLAENPGVRIYLLPINGIVKHDISIYSFKLKTRLISENSPLEFSVVEKNSGETGEENRTSLFLNKKRVAQSSASLTAGETKRILLRTNLSGGGFIAASARLSDDDLLFNNNAHFSFYVKTKRKILLVSAKGEELSFVRLALNAAQINNKVKAITFSKLDYENLGEYDAIFVAGLPAKFLSKVKNYVNKGGGLVVFPSAKSPVDFQNLINKFSLGKYYGVSNSDSGFPLLFDKVNLSDPVFEGLFKNKRDAKINSPKIIKHIRIKTEGAGRTIISLEDKSSFLSRFKYGRGKIFVFNITPAMGWSDFPVTPIFAPLMNRIVLYLTSRENQGTPIFAGSGYKIIKGLFNGSTVKVVTPDEREIIINSDELGNKNFYTFKATKFAGIYKVFSGKTLVDEFAVNVNPSESELKYFSADKLKKIFRAGKNKGLVKIIPQRENYSQSLLLESKGSELWRLFLFLSLLCALLEMIVARTGKNEFMNFIGK